MFRHGTVKLTSDEGSWSCGIMHWWTLHLCIAAIVSPPNSSVTVFGFTSASQLATAMLKRWWLCAVSLLLMRPFGIGVWSLARLTLTVCAAVDRDQGTSGIWMKVFLTINGRLHYLWRAVDQEGEVLDTLVQSRRDKKAAKKFFRKLLKGLRYVPGVIITDKLRSYSAARAEVMPSVEHIQQKYQNNRAENSHQPTRLRERVMKRYKSEGHAQRFLSSFGIITSHFRPRRHLCTAGIYRQMMKHRFAAWGSGGWALRTLPESDRKWPSDKRSINPFISVDDLFHLIELSWQYRRIHCRPSLFRSTPNWHRKMFWAPHNSLSVLFLKTRLLSLE